MRRNGLVALVAVVAVVGAACAGATPQVVVESAPAGGTETGIVVTGTGEAAGTPDTLTVTLGVSVLRGSVNEAITAAAERADALLDALRTAGVADRDLQTANYSIFPEYDYTGETQRLRGYRVTNTVVAKIRDLPRAGEILDAATRVAGDEVVVHGLSFSIEDDSALVVDARAKAFEEARAKAEQLASLAGVELGAPISIVESSSRVPVPFAGELRALAEADVTTPIEPGAQEVVVTVTVRFGIRG